MSPTAAVSSVLRQYAGFSGRARRSEFWWYFLFTVVLSIVVGFIDLAIHSSVLGYIISLGLLVPGLAVSVRRLHDTGRTGWWILIGLVPLIGTIVLIVFEAMDSQPGTNQYGPSPKAMYGGPNPYEVGPQY